MQPRTNSFNSVCCVLQRHLCVFPVFFWPHLSLFFFLWWCGKSIPESHAFPIVCVSFRFNLILVASSLQSRFFLLLFFSIDSNGLYLSILLSLSIIVFSPLPLFFFLLIPPRLVVIVTLSLTPSDLSISLYTISITVTLVALRFLISDFFFIVCMYVFG